MLWYDVGFSRHGVLYSCSLGRGWMAPFNRLSTQTQGAWCWAWWKPLMQNEDDYMKADFKRARFQSWPLYKACPGAESPWLMRKL